jgi:hypothetical protein
MKKKKIILIIGFIALVFLSRLVIKNVKNSKLSKTCLIDSFNKKFNDLDNAKLNSVFNFNESINCIDWNKILIVEAPYVHRSLIYLTSDVLIPDYDYSNINEGTYLLFFLDGNSPISKPIEFGGSDFIFSNNFNRFNYVKIDRDEAKFIYKKYEHSDFELYTLELLKRDSLIE